MRAMGENQFDQKCACVCGGGGGGGGGGGLQLYMEYIIFTNELPLQ